ncbi:MAG: class I SAM-dependent methyltransferase [Verrucomicrobiota bacterium JB022]|nr:class I SAM-dependent methyltransferase [Verrucomicrobiota bacterium JB022]
MLRVTEEAHVRVKALLREGDFVVDATAGNGHDTRLLSECVGDAGHVWAFDLQAVAIERTRALLVAHGMADNVTLIEASHAALAQYVPEKVHGQIALAMFNLGYLPSGDKAVTTHTPSTLQALAQAVHCLRTRGVLSVICYPGHSAGAEEADEVERWLAAQPGMKVETLKPAGTQRPSPFLLWAVKEQ